jgi:CMP/dCMP kinase
MTEYLVVAIDGPAGSGKSTVARAVATRLGLEVLDTGSMYRAITAVALRAGVDPADAERVAKLAEACDLRVNDRVVVDDVDVTDELRGAPVNEAVSVVSANPGVRAALVLRQRAWVSDRGGGVVEGRDIGTVVFPDATLKVFLTASDEERQRRRSGDEVAQSVARRDRLDQGRAASPLRRADDAHELDTTGRSADEVIDEVLAWL